MLKIKEHKKNCVVVAQSQTKGRGKEKRIWNSENNGNLYFSLLIETNKRQDYSQLSFLSSVAMRNTIQNAVSKWPNDVLLNNKKFCGILLEFDGDNLIIGCGVNIIFHPNDTNFPATDLKSEGIIVDKYKILKDFLLNFDNLREIWEKEGFNPIKEKWLEACYNLNKKIIVNGEEGIFLGINEAGSLLLKIDKKIKYINSGDIF
jgi:BirA family biotin operon repressor/biotin-[acetyl-CoA-carboxylase] ligase